MLTDPATAAGHVRVPGDVGDAVAAAGWAIVTAAEAEAAHDAGETVGKSQHEGRGHLSQIHT